MWSVIVAKTAIGIIRMPCSASAPKPASKRRATLAGIERERVAAIGHRVRDAYRHHVADAEQHAEERRCEPERERHVGPAVREHRADERGDRRDRDHHEQVRDVLAGEVGAWIVAGRDRHPQRGAVEAELVEREPGRGQHRDQREQRRRRRPIRKLAERRPQRDRREHERGR